MSQKVKVFRSKDPLLSVLMWGVSHSVSTRFSNLPLKSTLVKPKASAGMFSCRSTNCLMWVILLCWCRMTSKHSRNFAWTTISSTSEYYEWLLCLFLGSVIFYHHFCRERALYLLWRYYLLETDVSTPFYLFMALDFPWKSKSAMPGASWMAVHNKKCQTVVGVMSLQLVPSCDKNIHVNNHW